MLLSKDLKYNISCSVPVWLQRTYFRLLVSLSSFSVSFSFHLPQSSACALVYAILVFFSFLRSPSRALESTFTQFSYDTGTISSMADRACVFSIKSSSHTLFIWGNHNSRGPAVTNGKSLRFSFSGSGIGKTRFSEACMMVRGRRLKTTITDVKMKAVDRKVRSL